MPASIPTVPLPGTDRRVTRIGLGCMLLSTSGGPDRATGKAIVRRAVERGITFFDTADSYYADYDRADVGHNERLIAEALGEMGLRAGDDSPVLVATKGGQKRPGGSWVPEGSPAHLRAACHASLRALGVDAIALYQLHIPDPKVPFADSVGALAALREEGKIRAIGLSNVSLEELHEAQSITEISAVQNRFSPWVRHRHAPVLKACERDDLLFLAYAPLGGRQKAAALADSPQWSAAAKSLGLSPQELALVWALDQSPVVVPIPSATRPSTVDSTVHAAPVVLDGRARRRVSNALRRLPTGEGAWSKMKTRLRRLLLLPR